MHYQKQKRILDENNAVLFKNIVIKHPLYFLGNLKNKTTTIEDDQKIPSKGVQGWIL